MAGKIVADTLEHSTAGSIATNFVVNGSAKVWLDQNHRTSFGTNDSFNVSGVVDTSGGVLTVSFTNNMSAANYSAPVSGISQYGDTNASGAHMTVATDSANRASGALKTICNDYNNAARLDSERVDLTVFGDLA